MGLKSFFSCVRHSKPTALVGIAPAIWSAYLFRPSFRGVDIKICVGRGFEKQIGGFKGHGAFEVVNSAKDELAVILFTSGSTGAAKGVLYEHGMFLHKWRQFAANMELSQARWICRCYQYLHFLILRWACAP